MAEEKNADRSSIEIKTMLRKLHPDRGNHKDRIRRLNRFRTYVTVTGVSHCCATRVKSVSRNSQMPLFTIFISIERRGSGIL